MSKYINLKSDAEKILSTFGFVSNNNKSGFFSYILTTKKYIQTVSINLDGSFFGNVLVNTEIKNELLTKDVSFTTEEISFLEKNSFVFSNEEQLLSKLKESLSYAKESARILDNRL